MTPADLIELPKSFWHFIHLFGLAAAQLVALWLRFLEFGL